MIDVKGISAIVSIILILMIVVSLVSLTWTWFLGMFSNLSVNAQSSIEAATTSVGANFKIEAARNITGLPACCNVSVSIRNIGSSQMNVTRMSAYIDDEKKVVIGASIVALPKGGVATFNVSTTSDPKGKRLKLVSESGFEQSTTIT